MKFKIKTIHEESRSSEEDTYILGSLLQISDNNEYELYPYLYQKNNGSYIFFNLYLEAIDYFIGEKTMVRAYLTEEEFDNYYDNGLEISLADTLDWIK